MKLIKAILWIQLVLGLVGGYLALAHAHGEAMAAASAYGLQVEFERMQRAPDYHDPPAIRDQSIAQILDHWKASSRARSRVSFYWFLTSGAFATFAIVMLRTLGRTFSSNNRLGVDAGTWPEHGTGHQPSGPTQAGR